jgi:HNH endonuclease/AP2 domain
MAVAVTAELREIAAEDCLIPLVARDGSLQGYTLVDAGDIELLSRWTWHLSVGYATRCERVEGRLRVFRMHRVLLGLEHGDEREADHINRDKLDNRRANLRVASKSENAQNVRHGRGVSRHRGVAWHKRAGKWMAQAHLNGEQHYLGLFENEADAARAAAAFRAVHMPYSPEAAEVNR